MSGSNEHQAGHDPQSSIDIEQLADLQAGLLTPDEEQTLRGRIAADPAAAELLERLEQLRTDLGQLPDEPIPADVAARIDTALAAEAASSTSETVTATNPITETQPDREVQDLSAARIRRAARLPRWMVPAAGLAAATAVVAVVIGVLIRGATGPAPQPGSGPGAVSITSGQLAGQWPQITSQRELDFLAPPGKLQRCLSASGTAAASADPAQLLGARPLVVDGKYGVLVAVPVRDAAVSGRPVELIVFGPNCAVSPPAQPDVIARTVIPT